MVFSSITFLCFFLPALFLCYFLVPQKFRGARNLVLLLFSLFFYRCSGADYLGVLLTSIGVTYLCGLLLAPHYTRRVRRFGLCLAVVCHVGLLGWFKYANFVAQNLNILGLEVPIPQVVLPIGISFFTFQGLSYLIDAYLGRVQYQRNVLKVALYMALFPQLVAGPIVRYSTVEQEIAGRCESLSEFSEGAVRFLFGLGKKMLLANAMGEIADGIFAQQTATMSVSLAWVGAFAYAFQIYFDFSAYSDMAIGLGRMFGFHFLENFNYPYIAKSITEFWRRWHISLSSWFRDYIYIPLGGSRCSRGRHIFNLSVVWLLTGLWHGAAWNFVLWGLWFLVFLVGEKYLWGAWLSKRPAVVRHGYTLLLVLFSWVLFRSANLSYAVGFFGAMFGAGSGVVADGQAVYYLLEYWPEWVACILASLPVKVWLENQVCGRETRGALFLAEWFPKGAALSLLLLSYIKLASGSFNPFIYFQF